MVLHVKGAFGEQEHLLHSFRNGDVIIIGGGENLAAELGAKMAAINLLRMMIGRQRDDPSFFYISL